MDFLFFAVAECFSTYYFQAVLKPKAAFIVSVSRGQEIVSEISQRTSLSEQYVHAIVDKAAKVFF